MNTAGIICEYNPFHRAHEYHIRKTKEALGEDSSVICVMSSSFVQRGEPAMFSKFARAEAAVRGGADLVIELPVLWSLAPAERFAMGGVFLLMSTGICSHLSFGSESGNAENISEIAELLMSREIDNAITNELTSGISYAAAREQAVRSIIGGKADILRSPNDILGIEYIKALKALMSDIEPMAVRRSFTDHDGSNTTEKYASATAIRGMIKCGGDYAKYMPQYAAEIIEDEINNENGPVTMEDLETAILARLRTMTELEFEELPENSEGLHMRLMRCCRTLDGLEEIMQGTKSKRYAMARIKRMIMFAALGIKQSDLFGFPPYIRVLAFNDTGREILREMRKKAKLPIITRPAAAKKLRGEALRVMEIEVKATDIYALGRGKNGERRAGSEWRTGAIKIS